MYTYRILCSRFAEYAFIPSKHGTVTKLAISWTTLYKFQRIETVFSDHSVIKLEINNKKIPRKFPVYLKIKKYPSQQPKGQSRGHNENQKHFQFNYSKRVSNHMGYNSNSTYKFIALNACIREDRLKIYEQSIHFKMLEKRTIK